MTATAIYSTTTGVTNPPVPASLIEKEPELAEYDDRDVWPSCCFVCSPMRLNHFGEHDDLVDAGLARNDPETGNVYRTEAYTREAAWDVLHAAYPDLYLESQRAAFISG